MLKSQAVGASAPGKSNSLAAAPASASAHPLQSTTPRPIRQTRSGLGNVGRQCRHPLGSVLNTQLSQSSRLVPRAAAPDTDVQVCVGVCAVRCAW